jgi:hypothetical protein
VADVDSGSGADEDTDTLYRASDDSADNDNLTSNLDPYVDGCYLCLGSLK